MDGWFAWAGEVAAVRRAGRSTPPPPSPPAPAADAGLQFSAVHLCHCGMGLARFRGVPPEAPWVCATVLRGATSAPGHLRNVAAVHVPHEQPGLSTRLPA
jgi:hypothetical protein